jgi:hypothetical protein
MVSQWETMARNGVGGIEHPVISIEEQSVVIKITLLVAETGQAHAATV